MLSSTAARPIHQIRQAADDSRGVNHWFSLLAPIPSLLASTNRLVVAARLYVVGAAPGHHPDPGSGLPPASTGHCDDQRRTPPSAGFLSASWRTVDLVVHIQVVPQSLPHIFVVYEYSISLLTVQRSVNVSSGAMVKRLSYNRPTVSPCSIRWGSTWEGGLDVDADR